MRTEADYKRYCEELERQRQAAPLQGIPEPGNAAGKAVEELDRIFRDGARTVLEARLAKRIAADPAAWVNGRPSCEWVAREIIGECSVAVGTMVAAATLDLRKRLHELEVIVRKGTT